MSKIILVTGASSGIGKAAAKQLIADGHTVYTAARRMELMDDLKTLGGHPIELDITNDQQVQQVVKSVIAKEGRIDVLFNNAGFAVYGSVEETSIADARSQFDVNIFGLANLTQQVIPYMRKAGAGTIINTSSMGGKMYTPLGAWYHASKHALEGWSDCLRLELQQFNINVVVLEPGGIETEFGDVMEAPMIRRSGKGPYAAMVQGLVKSYKNIKMSKTSVIADIVSKIVKSKHPATRYRAGKWAKPMVWMRIYLGDKMFDKIVTSQLK